MNNLTTTDKQIKEVTVNPITGEAFISKTRTAELIGIPASTFRDFLTREGIAQSNQPLTTEMFTKAVGYYALDKPNPTAAAKELYRQIALAGAKAYLYNEAGLSMNAVARVVPLTQLEAFKELVRLEEERIALLETVTQQSGLLVQQKEVIDHKKIVTGEGEDYFPVSVISDNTGISYSGRRLNKMSDELGIASIPMFASKGQNQVKAYHWSVWEAAYPDVILPE